MKHINKTGFLVLVSSAVMAWSAFAFDSGSTGEDGALSPTEDVIVSLPPSGILNYTTINIPEGVTVKFSRNNMNTPAYLLVQGNATINGTIDLSGRDGRSLNSLPPGGYAGGVPSSASIKGGNGLGPGAGYGSYSGSYGGAGASHFLHVGSPYFGSDTYGSYGNNSLQPLIGGSGGGAGYIASGIEGRVFGTAGGSGGGAILISVSGTLSLSGSILANGGNGESVIGDEFLNLSISGGGGGSGGAVRLVTTNYTGTGRIDVSGGAGGTVPEGNSVKSGINGSYGRVSIEYEIADSHPVVVPTDFVQKLPQPIFLDNLPTIKIASVNDIATPSVPSGEGDIVIPDNAPNKVTLNIEATNVPEGTSVRLLIDLANSGLSVVTTEGLVLEDGVLKTSYDLTLREGNNRIVASLGFSVSSLQSQTLARFTNGETVKHAELASAMGGKSQLRLTTVSGREYLVDPAAVQ